MLGRHDEPTLKFAWEFRTLCNILGSSVDTPAGSQQRMILFQYRLAWPYDRPRSSRRITVARCRQVAGGKVRPRPFNAHVKLDLASHPQALRLPITAVNQEGQSATVMVASRGSALRRSVSLGLTQPDYVEIASGLSPDDLIINPFNPDLRDGETVSYAEPLSGASKTAQIAPGGR